MQTVGYDEIEVKIFLEVELIIFFQNFAKEKNCPFYIVSAKNNSNILEAFVDAVRRTIEKR